MIPYRVTLNKTDTEPIELVPVEEDEKDGEILILAQREFHMIIKYGPKKTDEAINIMLMATSADEALKRALAIRASVLNAGNWESDSYGLLEE